MNSGMAGKKSKGIQVLIYFVNTELSYKQLTSGF
jgi:hypothetical protein